MHIIWLIMTSLTIIHWSDYWTATLVTLTSFTPWQQSGEIKLADVASWAEFFIMNLICTGFMLGLLWILGLEHLRMMSMFNGKANFNHRIKQTRRYEYECVVVTRGTFGTYRYPSYMSWLGWSLGIQPTQAEENVEIRFISEGVIQSET